ncbi:DUF6876 family protein [Chryseobacterium sp. SL1]|uniref:DUF6876 family protein n=1 Tax=Chryseobacterium sp. SL1 TaxID=2995159 RepID=UPI003FA37B09
MYDIYTVTEKLIKYKSTFNLTQGINDIVLYEDCFWFIDIICHHKINFDVELWELRREKGNLFTITGKNKLQIKFVELHNIQSDFYFDDLTIVKKGKLLCLPIEESMY